MCRHPVGVPTGAFTSPVWAETFRTESLGTAGLNPGESFLTLGQRLVFLR